MLTGQMRRCLVEVERAQWRTGISPSLEELAQKLSYKGSNKASAKRLLDGLEARGFIRKSANRARAIEVLRPVSKFAAFKFDEASKDLMPFT